MNIFAPGMPGPVEVRGSDMPDEPARCWCGRELDREFLCPVHEDDPGPDENEDDWRIDR